MFKSNQLLVCLNKSLSDCIHASESNKFQKVTLHFACPFAGMIFSHKQVGVDQFFCHIVRVTWARIGFPQNSHAGFFSDLRRRRRTGLVQGLTCHSLKSSFLVLRSRRINSMASNVPARTETKANGART